MVKQLRRLRDIMRAIHTFMSQEHEKDSSWIAIFCSFATVMMFAELVDRVYFRDRIGIVFVLVGLIVAGWMLFWCTSEDKRLLNAEVEELVKIDEQAILRLGRFEFWYREDLWRQPLQWVGFSIVRTCHSGCVER
jgi:hypothetical protein